MTEVEIDVNVLDAYERSGGDLRMTLQGVCVRVINWTSVHYPQ